MVVCGQNGLERECSFAARDRARLLGSSCASRHMGDGCPVSRAPTRIPSPSAAAAALITMIKDGSAAHNMLVSLFRVGMGFLLGSTIAFALCCSYWLVPTLRSLTELTVELLRPIPPVALIPFAIFVLGLGDAPAIFLVTFAAFFPMQAVTDAAFSSAPRDQIDVARTFGGSKPQILRYVVIPASHSAIGAGLRTSAGIAWFVVIVAELVGAQDGLGYLIQDSRLSFRLDRAVAAIVLIALSALMVQLTVFLVTRLISSRGELDA